MVTTDFNEDGLDDLLMAGMNGVTTYLNLGNSGFDYRPVANIEGAAHLHAIDLDLDGDMDVGFWVPDTERVYWAEQLEVDSWDVHLIQDFGDSSGTISDVVFSDVDGDGDWDCLVAEITGTIFWTENKKYSLVDGQQANVHFTVALITSGIYRHHSKRGVTRQWAGVFQFVN